jgi:hypothetical protein
VAVPAAAQNVAEEHDTELRESSINGEAVIGLGVTVHLLLSNVSTRVSWKLPCPL